jgi:hypothetical protein
MADTQASETPWIGRYVIVRTSAAGVHAGVLKSRNERECELSDARRLWRWRVKDNAGISLSDVATLGLDSRDTRISAPVDILLTENCEIIGCTAEAEESIRTFATAQGR